MPWASTWLTPRPPKPNRKDRRFCSSGFMANSSEGHRSFFRTLARYLPLTRLLHAATAPQHFSNREPREESQLHEGWDDKAPTFFQSPTREKLARTQEGDF